MPLRLDIKKKLHTRSDRVKSVEFHTSLPWVLTALYSGHLIIYNWEDQSAVKTIEATANVTVRCARFIERKNWVVCGCDDFQVRVFNYHSLEKVKQWEAHSDFIRYLTVHPKLPFVLTASDDMSIRCWDWTKGWSRVCSFEGHLHYVMMLQWNPRDLHLFASASLDRTVKVWGLPASAIRTSSSSNAAAATTTTTGTTTGTTTNISTTASVVVSTPHLSLTGHESGVNCLAYSSMSDKPYIAGAGDDGTIRIWDYQTKHSVSVLTGHTGPVHSIVFHPSLPIILSGSDDGSVILWHAGTFKKELTLRYTMGRIWSIAASFENNNAAIASDEGTVVISLGSNRVPASMHSGKIVLSKAYDLCLGNLKLVPNIDDLQDGEPVPVTFKEVGRSELFAQHISHHPNGRLAVVCGDGEYIVYTAQALRSREYGKALDFVWSSTGLYAIKDDQNKITVHSGNAPPGGGNAAAAPGATGSSTGSTTAAGGSSGSGSGSAAALNEVASVNPPFVVDGLFGGHLLAVKSSSDFLCFYDWQSLNLIRRIDVAATGVYWNDKGTELIVTTADSFFLLKYNCDAVTDQPGEESPEAFELCREVAERVTSGLWIFGVFCFTTAQLRLQSFTSGQIENLSFLEHPAWILGYVPEHDRLYLIDRNLTITSYKFQAALAEYMTAIACREFERSEKTLKIIPEDLHTRLARFLESQGLRDTALQITKDLDHKFELAYSLENIDVCLTVLNQIEELQSKSKQSYFNSALLLGPLAGISGFERLKEYWARLGDIALRKGSLAVAANSYLKSEEAEGLFMLGAATGDAVLLEKVVEISKKQNRGNLAIMSLILLNRVDECVDLLLEWNRIPEAALFCKSYARHRGTAVVELWKKRLSDAGQAHVAEALSDFASVCGGNLQPLPEENDEDDDDDRNTAAVVAPSSFASPPLAPPPDLSSQPPSAAEDDAAAPLSQQANFLSPPPPVSSTRARNDSTGKQGDGNTDDENEDKDNDINYEDGEYQVPNIVVARPTSPGPPPIGSSPTGPGDDVSEASTKHERTGKDTNDDDDENDEKDDDDDDDAEKEDDDAGLSLV